jgi:hypothetical protein
MPSRPLAGLAVTSPLGDGYGTLAGSRADLLRLGAWARLAATSPHSVVYLPLAIWRGSPRDATELRRSVDLVLARTDAAPRPSRWPALRRQLRHGRPVTLQAPEARPAADLPAWRAREVEPTVAEHAATLFVTGTAKALFDLGDTLTEAGEEVAGSREIHRHGTAYLVGLRGFDPGHRWEFDVIGVDPIFHKRRWARLRAAERRTDEAPTARAAALTVRRAPARTGVLARSGRHLGR